MNKQDVISFFDRLAPTWDADVIRNDAVTVRISDEKMYQVCGRKD